MKNSNSSAKLIVSLDFELFWGMQDGHTLESYQDHVLGGREAIPKLLSLFEKHGIHATWATVGFMFAESYEELKRYFPEPGLLPHYDNEKLSPYRIFGTIGETEASAPCFYAPSLIRLVAQTPGQEIGSHTFSHYYCRAAGQTVEQFRADMRAAVSLAGDKGFSLRSIVLPRNQFVPSYNSVLKELGFTAFRDEENDWIHEKLHSGRFQRMLRLMDVYFPLTGQGGYLAHREQGLVNLTGSRMFKPVFRPLIMMEGLKLHRIKRQMLHAAKNGLYFHLWWHPHNIGVRTERHLQQLEELFRYYEQLRDQYGMQSMNMGEAAELFTAEESRD
jgi:hypothetical protein